MTARQRAELLAPPDREAAMVAHHSPDAGDLAAIGTTRTPATRLGYALQLCCLRYPGRHLRAGERLPAIMLDHIAEQVGVETSVIADFARRMPTRSPRSRCVIVEKVTLIRRTGVSTHPIDPTHQPRLAQFAREGVRYTAQAFQQMRAARRRVVLLATVREMEATLTDAAIAMFGALVGRAHLRARKRLEQRAAVSNKEGRERLLRVSAVLEAMVRAARAGDDVTAAVNAIASLDMLDADAAVIRRTASPHRDDVPGEIAPEYRAFKRSGPAFLRAFDFQAVDRRGKGTPVAG